LSEKSSRRKVRLEDWVSLGWFGLLALAVAIYWVYNPSLLSELINVFQKAFSGEMIVFSEGVVTFVMLLAGLSAVRFFVLMAASAVHRDYPLTIGNSVFAVVSIVLGYTFNSWYQVNLSPFEVVRILLILTSLYMVSKGIASGWFHENKRRILAGDWKTVILGAKVLVLGLLFTEKSFLVLCGFTVFLAEKLSITLAPSSFLASSLTFLGTCLFVFLVTELPIRLVFTKCKRCGMLFLNIGAHVSSWDSEHTSRHRHCPRCGAPCF